MLFFISNIFIGHASLKFAKNQSKSKQHPGPELLLFENYSLYSSTLSCKNDRRYFKKCTQNKFVYFNEVMRLITMKVTLRMKNISHRYNINRPRHRHGHKYTKYEVCLRIIMVISSNTQAAFEAQFMKKLSNTEAQLKARVAYENGVNIESFSLFIK